MPFLESEVYRASLLFKNAHINTIYPYLFRKKPFIEYTRKRYTTPDDDFFDVDWIKNNQKRVIILLHGLEGSAQSQYVLGTASLAMANQFDVAAFHFRSCSGEMNLKLPMYHSGFTQDLYHLVKEIEPDYEEIFISGFSLGGNVTMKYMGDGDYPLSPKIRACSGVSVPCDLEGGSVKLMQIQNRMYELNFLKSLLAKVIEKNKRFPDIVSLKNLKKVKYLWDFDEYYTTCLHGFKDAKDYYQSCSSLAYLKNISIPTLMINARDDSFLSDLSYPIDLAKMHDYLHLIVPKNGGHVGFSGFGNQAYWNEIKIIQFFEQFSSLPKSNVML